MTGFDLSTISAAYLGSTPINEIYFGSTKIWPTVAPFVSQDFDYTGTVQDITLQAGYYKIQCWGAQGGSNEAGTWNNQSLSSQNGGKGGYSEGILHLTQATTLYVFVGGQPAQLSSSSTNGGWNGGGGGTGTCSKTGNSGGYSKIGGGGGATDVALVTSTMEYSSYRTNRSSASLLSRFIVAGGGSGGAAGAATRISRYYTGSTTGFAGGGTSGLGNLPGTQSSAGTDGGFGYGANHQTAITVGAPCGGGGWYGGGASGTNSTVTAASAVNNALKQTGGGSGFVNTSANSSYRPSNYTGLELVTGSTYAGDQSFEAVDGTTETGHSGNGYCRISATEFDEKLYTPLTFEIVTGGTLTWRYSGSGSTRTIKYRVNGGSWDTFYNSTTLNVVAGDIVQFCKDGSGTVTFAYSEHKFGGTCTFKAKNNIMSLINAEDFATITQIPSYQYMFSNMFYQCTGLLDAYDLLLPATTLYGYCYNHMFRDCSSLVRAPKKLPALTLAEYCYNWMFLGCSSLTSAPELPATTLAEGSYIEMFDGCTSLTSAPEMPEATFVASQSYMFYNCTNLSYVKCLWTGSPNPYQWLHNVAATGTFVKKAGVTWPSGESGIPSGWTVEEV